MDINTLTYRVGRRSLTSHPLLLTGWKAKPDLPPSMGAALPSLHPFRYCSLYPFLDIVIDSIEIVTRKTYSDS